MAEKKGFFQNPAPDLMMGFKEGNVEVLESSFKVVHPDTPVGGTDPGAHPALVWKVRRLDDELEPILHPETEEPLTETLTFGIGNKMLSKIHPGGADSPEDQDIEDKGTADDAEGNTLFFVDPNVQIHAKAGARVLYASLEDGVKDAQGKLFFPGAGVNPKFTGRVWAPDWKGCIFHMKGFANPEFLEMEGRKDASKKFAVPYKIVDKVHRGPGEKGGKGGKAAGTAGEKTEKAGKSEKADKADKSDKGGAANNGIDPDVLALTKKVLNKLSEVKSGEELTFKLFNKAAGDILGGLGADPKMLMPVTQLIKNEDWLMANAKDLDFTIDLEGRTVKVG